ncbi:MAG: D-amino acid aminotransferase [Verrucomicrobiota bacterium]
MIVHLNGEFLPKEQARISPDDRGFLFADGVYEVARVYPAKGLFAAQAHWDRLERSLRELQIKLPQPADWQGISEELLRRNHLKRADAIIYLQITRGAAPRKHAFPDDATPTIYGFAMPFTPPVEKWKKGVKAITAPDIRWTRCDIKTVSLLPNVLANQRSKENGADEAVLIRDGVVTEGSHSNFAGVFGDTLVTHPLSNLILGGITRGVVLDLCRKLKIPVREFPILETELAQAREMMLLGTTTEVLPVVQLNDVTVGNGRPGPVTRKLQEAFWKLTQ